MAERLTDRLVKALPAPAAGNRIAYDAEVAGFGCRVTSAGAKAFVVNYRIAGRERRLTIGAHPDWSVSAARDRARAIKREVDVGLDPMARRDAERETAAAPRADINMLADRFVAEHLPKRRPSTVASYAGILDQHIRPRLGRTLIAELRHSDVETLHCAIAADAPVRANRVVAVLSKMMTLAVKWELATANPVRGIERAPEVRRERFLSPAEIGRLAAALDAIPDRAAVNAIRLLLLTGARRGETMRARWDEFELDGGTWTKPAASTKQGRVHRIPLSDAAVALLREIRVTAEAKAAFVFVGRTGRPLTDIKATWSRACHAAGLTEVRLHDLRHTYASILASAGMSLPLIGRLLGHTQAATTARYAHLLDDPLREATERVAAVVTASRG